MGVEVPSLILSPKETSSCAPLWAALFSLVVLIVSTDAHEAYCQYFTATVVKRLLEESVMMHLCWILLKGDQRAAGGWTDGRSLWWTIKSRWDAGGVSEPLHCWKTQNTRLDSCSSQCKHSEVTIKWVNSTSRSMQYGVHAVQLELCRLCDGGNDSSLGVCSVSTVEVNSSFPVRRTVRQSVTEHGS